MGPRKDDAPIRRAPRSEARETACRKPPKSAAPATTQPELRLAPVRPLQEVHDVNQRCIEMLVQAARSERPGTFFLVKQLRDVLRAMTPETRARAARHAFLLVDLEFADADWWQRAKTHPARSEPLPLGRGTFPRRAALQLARAAVTLAWHSVRADPAAAGVMLGMHAAVSSLVARLSLTEIDRIIERRFQHVRPRWEDRPNVWLQLLRAAQTEDIRRARDFNLRGLQLIAGTLITK